MNWIAGILIAAAAVFFYRGKIASEWERCRSNRRQWLFEKWKNWGEPFLVALVLAVLIRTFLLGPYKIPTGSMRPTFMEGDRIFVDKVSYHFKEPERGDIIVFKYPLDKKKDFVKRLAGLPGETILIRDGRIVVNGKTLDQPEFQGNYYYNRDDWDFGKRDQLIQVPEGHYFALGDNSAQSSDSRNWGFVPEDNLVGKAVVIWWPPNRARLVN